VGTVTEIYDYLRLLWARIGHPHCPPCRAPIGGQSAEQTIDPVMALAEGTGFMVLAPVVRGRQGEYCKLFDGLRAVAALTVFAGHTVTGVFSLATHKDLFLFASKLADEGVAVFFVISGFLLYRPFVAAQSGSAGSPRIPRRRQTRPRLRGRR